MPVSFKTVPLEVNTIHPAFYGAIQILLIALYAYNKVCLALSYCLYYLMLAAYSVYCHHASFQVQGLDKPGDGLYLIALLSNPLLSKCHSISRHPGADHP